MSTVKEQYANTNEFVELLVDAQIQASTEWEIDFVENLLGIFERYGPEMHLSANRRQKLEDIAQ